MTTFTNGESGSSVRTKINAAITTVDGLTKTNLSATVAPTVTDDTSAGYAAGSRWLNVTTGQMWTARSVSAGAAAWEMLDLADHPGYVSGFWYHANTGISLANGVALAASTVRLIPMVLKSRVTITQIGCRITTAAASGNIQFAIYANNPATSRPTGNALLTTVSQSTTTTGPFGVALSGGNITLEAGVYWFAANADNSTVVCQVYATAQVVAGYMMGSASLGDITATGGTTGVLALSVATQTFGTWNDLTSASFSILNTNSYVAPMFKVA